MRISTSGIRQPFKPHQTENQINVYNLVMQFAPEQSPKTGGSIEFSEQKSVSKDLLPQKYKVMSPRNVTEVNARSPLGLDGTLKQQMLHEFDQQNRIVLQLVSEKVQRQTNHKNLTVTLKPKQGLDNPNFIMSMIRRFNHKNQQKTKTLFVLLHLLL